MKLVVRELASLVDNSQNPAGEKKKNSRPETETHMPVRSADVDASAPAANKVKSKEINLDSDGSVKQSRLAQPDDDEFADF